MDDMDSKWRDKGATLSDKTARKEFGLTQSEIVRAIRAGQLQYQVCSMHGDHYLKDQQAKSELARINSELRRLKRQIAALEERKAKLTERGA